MTEAHAHIEGRYVKCPIVSRKNVRRKSRPVTISNQYLHGLQLDSHSPDDVAKVWYVVHI